MELINSHDILIKSIANKWHGELNGKNPPQLGSHLEQQTNHED